MALTDIGSSRPLLDIASYARRGPGQRDRLSQEEIALIARTVRRTPEVMVKVLSRGGQDMKAVRRHFSYLSRKGGLTIESDDGQELRGKEAEADLLKDWDLDIQEQRPTSSLGPGLTRKAPKLVHKVLFSMPPGTPPKKVLEAVKVFAREELGSKHRYAMVLHTDEPHPHVHMVVKAVNEEGVRLNIRKGMLREWRREFARRLREQGVPANATERAVRGSSIFPMSDGVFRAIERGAFPSLSGSSPANLRNENARHVFSQFGKTALETTRRNVVQGWTVTAGLLAQAGETALAAGARSFVNRFEPPVPDLNQIATPGFRIRTLEPPDHAK